MRCRKFISHDPTAAFFQIQPVEYSTNILVIVADEHDERSEGVDHEVDGPLQPLETGDGFLLGGESFGGLSKAVMKSQLQRRGGD